jgi:hypothetical protein
MMRLVAKAGNALVREDLCVMLQSGDWTDGGGEDELTSLSWLEDPRFRHHTGDQSGTAPSQSLFSLLNRKRKRPTSGRPEEMHFFFIEL